MLYAQCMVCNDKRKFQSTVNDVERIANVLSHIVGETKDVTDHQLWNSIRMNQKHPHLMCGHCSHVNEMQLKNAEGRVHDYVYALCEILREKEVKDINVHDALRTLQGHYPMLYKIVDREYRKGKTHEE